MEGCLKFINHRLVSPQHQFFHEETGMTSTTLKPN